MKSKKDNLSYDEAISRLDHLVKQLEEGEQGMDDLTKMVKEASDLVKVCKQKLKMTSDEIKKAFEEE
ncbi:exodeoxyribonuclease VII small subunit [Cyclobacterium qasimii]|uniref:Exodeoxyribonuclease VII small subunit n=1 Tax=Cyclobacterium qasimii TaxID=1350429 RepID=A0A512CE90_9BACT|nr:exodeoxyribonuclease VII small subunit [Cyclobacterium qasimii]GEO22506.1 hypothetical protein CQA01_30400 [Cyclobacterium qasimii]